MKTFNQFLAEITLYDKSTDGEGEPSRDDYLKNSLSAGYMVGDHRSPSPEGYAVLGTTKSKHKVWHEGEMDANDSKVSYNEYQFHDPHEDGKMDIVVHSTAQEHPNGVRTHRVDSIVSRSNPALPAHKAYSFLLDDRKNQLVTDIQTPGTVDVWRKLAKEPDVHVHGIDHDGQPCHVDLENDAESVYDRWSERKDPYLAKAPKYLVAYKP